VTTGKARKLLLAVAGVLILAFLVHIVQGYNVISRFERVPIGASKFEVVRLLGRPWKMDKCGERFGNPNQPGCAEEYLYRHPLAPLVPNYYSISFDASGHVLDKFVYSSP
jgi:hypothetical protein